VVYFARLADGTIKIGSSEHLNQRMKSLSCQYRGRPTVLLTIPGDVHTEKAVHWLFRLYRVNRWEERFLPEPCVVEWICYPGLLFEWLERSAPEIQRLRDEAEERWLKQLERYEEFRTRYSDYLQRHGKKKAALQAKRGDCSPRKRSTATNEVT
jgi:hypothetical protein